MGKQVTCHRTARASVRLNYLSAIWILAVVFTCLGQNAEAKSCSKSSDTVFGVPAECGSGGIYVSESVHNSVEFSVVDVIHGTRRSTISKPGIELDDDIPNVAGSYIGANSIENTVRVTAYCSPDIICFDCIQRDGDSLGLCRRSIPYWRATSVLLKRGVDIAAEGYLQSDNPTEVAAAVDFLMKHVFENNGIAPASNPSALGRIHVRTLARNYSPPELTETEQMSRFIDPHGRTDFSGENLECRVAAERRGRAVELLVQLENASDVNRGRWSPIPAWWEDAAQEAAALIIAFANTPPHKRCAAMWAADCVEAADILAKAGYQTSTPRQMEPGCADVYLIIHSLTANHAGESVALSLSRKPEQLVSGSELIDLADDVQDSASGRRTDAPPLSWWPLAARLLLLTLDASAMEVRQAGCRAYRAMGLVPQCDIHDDKGVPKDDQSRVRKFVSDNAGH